MLYQLSHVRVQVPGEPRTVGRIAPASREEGIRLLARLPTQDPPGVPARRVARREGRGRLLGRRAEQVGQFGLNVHEVALVAGRHERVGPPQEVGDVLDRCLEVCLAER